LQGKISISPLIPAFERHDPPVDSNAYHPIPLPTEQPNFFGRTAEKIALAEE
jgi:hypothetical protein